jgi:hypothetical protein
MLFDPMGPIAVNALQQAHAEVEGNRTIGKISVSNTESLF